MSELRYNKVFKQGIAAISIFILLFGSIIVFFIASKVQYDLLVADMKIVEATVVDIDYIHHTKGPHEQEIFIEYIVDGVTYSRELDTDTVISFSVGTGANYFIGDKIDIFYDQKDPEIIATPRSVGVGAVYFIFALIGLGFVLFALRWMIKKRSKFLVTQEEYIKDRQSKKANKKRKNKG